MRILYSILVFFSLHVLLIPVVLAQTRRMPGGSAYFSTQTIRTTVQRDNMRVKLNLSIHQLANGDHAKSMAIRAFLYSYCGEQAKKYMQNIDIEGRGLHEYQQYIYLQTQLYQSLQPTVYKLRVIMDDKNISFPIILSHLQSDDPKILSYYKTIPQRYIDISFFTDIEKLQQGLNRYMLANDRYPISLDELITYKYVPSTIILSSKKILYRAYNLSDIVPYILITPNRGILYNPTYILLYQAQYKNNIEYFDTLESMRRKILIFSLPAWQNIKKTPPQFTGKGVGWKIAFPIFD